jgi:hypothetical protein
MADIFRATNLGNDTGAPITPHEQRHQVTGVWVVFDNGNTDLSVH